MSNQIAYRLGTGTPVTLESARAIWTAVAREVLDGTSSASIAYSELGRQVQQRSGVYTRMPVAEWLPAVLVELDDAALTSRVRTDAPPAAPRAKAKVARPRAEPTARKREEAPPAICPTCFMQLPASGRCDTCT